MKIMEIAITYVHDKMKKKVSTHHCILHGWMPSYCVAGLHGRQLKGPQAEHHTRRNPLTFLMVILDSRKVNWSTWHKRRTKKKIWVLDRNQIHNFQNNKRPLYSLSYENSWRAWRTWLALSGFEQPSPGALLLGLANEMKAFNDIDYE